MEAGTETRVMSDDWVCSTAAEMKTGMWIFDCFAS